MKIEIREVKEAKFNSHETVCFEARVFIDGVSVGKVSNAGQGGCHRYQTLALEKQLDDYAKTLPPIKIGEGEDATSYPASADSVIDDLLTDSYIEKQVRSILRKGIFVMRGDSLLTVKKPKGMTDDCFRISTTTPEGIADTLKQLRADRIVTDMAELVELMKRP